MVADHLGHNIDVHTDVYKLQSSLLEKTKVAKVLTALDNGMVTAFKGRSINDITVEGNKQWTHEVYAMILFIVTLRITNLAKQRFISLQKHLCMNIRMRGHFPRTLSRKMIWQKTIMKTPMMKAREINSNSNQRTD